MLFPLNQYSFFDYKGNIANYNGYDYDHGGRLIYMISSLVIILVLVIIFRKAKKENVHKYIRIMGIVMTLLYIIKTTWESYYDITTGAGFNKGILPFDTCSILMWAGLIGGFAKGKLKKAADAWLATGGLVGGIANLLFLRALLYYPFFTFAAFYSMLWHAVMVFTGLWLLTTNYVESNFKSILHAFVFHMAISVPVIIFDYTWLKGYDFMLYAEAGGIPVFDGLADKLIDGGNAWLVPFMVIILYFASFCILIYGSLGLKMLFRWVASKFKKENQTA